MRDCRAGGGIAVGKIKTIGLDELISDMAALAELPGSVVESMLHAKADVIEPAQKKKAQAWLEGKYSQGVTAESIKRGKSKTKKNGMSLIIKPEGRRVGPRSRKSRRNEEVAFINEFGKRGQPARPFIGAANKESEAAATGAAAKVLENFIEKLNL
jgi:HK97 gp10 family phage protein